jgi:hypothetical protein
MVESYILLKPFPAKNQYPLKNQSALYAEQNFNYPCETEYPRIDERLDTPLTAGWLKGFPTPEMDGVIDGAQIFRN